MWRGDVSRLERIWQDEFRFISFAPAYRSVPAETAEPPRTALSDGKSGPRSNGTFHNRPGPARSATIVRSLPASSPKVQREPRTYRLYRAGFLSANQNAPYDRKLTVATGKSRGAGVIQVGPGGAPINKVPAGLNRCAGMAHA